LSKRETSVKRWVEDSRPACGGSDLRFDTIQPTATIWGPSGLKVDAFCVHLRKPAPLKRDGTFAQRGTRTDKNV
jgi:hypothetical protein